MTTYQDLPRQIGDQWVAALKRTEDVLVSAASSVRAVDTPQIPIPQRVSKLGDAIADRAPLPSEIVEANFELTERLLRAQRDLTLRLLGETAPTTAAATKATAKKARARTATK